MGLSLITKALKALSSLTVAANKIPYFSSTSAAGSLDLVDEDTMSSDSATAVPTQQSVKAYVDAESGCKLLETTTVSPSSATVTIGDGVITSDYTRYVIEISGLKLSSSSNTTLNYEISTNGGSTWVDSGYYSFVRHVPIIPGFDDNDYATNASIGLLVGNAALQIARIQIDLTFHNVSGGFQDMSWKGLSRLAASSIVSFFGSGSLTTSKVNALRLSAGAGTLDGGLIKIYGYK